MVDLAPFRGLRFDPARYGHDLAALTAPPYDAIGDDDEARLLGRHPLNVVRLELGAPGDEAGTGPADDTPSRRYAQAAADLRRWYEQGHVVAEPRPALYVYEQRFDHRGHARRQVGVVGALRLTAWDTGQVLPHEHVMPGPVADRLALLRALPVNVSPVFLLATETPGEVADVLERTTAEPADCGFTDDGGVEHRMWVVTDAGATQAVARGYAPRSLLMADGHHRYTAALEHRARSQRRGADRIMAYVVGADTGPAIDPTHRLVRRLPDGALAQLDALGFDRRATDLAPADLARSLEEHPAATFGLVSSHGCEVLRGDPGTVRELVRDVPSPVDQLDVAVLQAVLLDELGVPDDIDQLRYTSDLEDAVAAVRRGDADALFLVRPVPFDRFRAACEAGVRMPPKSTAFTPKPRTGLVMRALDPSSPPGLDDGSVS